MLSVASSVVEGVMKNAGLLENDSSTGEDRTGREAVDIPLVRHTFIARRYA